MALLKAICQGLLFVFKDKFLRPFAIVLLIIVSFFLYNTYHWTKISGYVRSVPVEDKFTAFNIEIDGKNETELFVNVDNPWIFKFNSRDVAKKLYPDVKCVIYVNWVRFPPFSWSRNIVKIIEATPPPKK